MTGYPRELNDRCFNTLSTFSQFDTLDGIRSLLVGEVLQAFHNQVEFIAPRERCVRNFLLKFWNHKLNETDWFMVLFLKELHSTTLDYDVKRELEKLPIEIKAFLDGNPGKIAQSPNISFYQVQEGAKQDQAYVQKVSTYNNTPKSVDLEPTLQSSAYKKLLELFLACPTLSTADGQKLIIKQLSYGKEIELVATPRTGVLNIVQRAFQKENGFQELVSLVHYFDYDCIALNELNRYLTQIGLA